MKTNYSIEEILSAVEEIHNSKKKKIKEQSFNQSTKIANIDIPKNTLRLIEEAEKSKD
tara:strand:+ start:603 stop:776 length:174 start_codon:yes stop_codon:yes gene_type:complete